MADLVHRRRLPPRLLLLPHQRPDQRASDQADAGQPAHDSSRDRTRLALLLLLRDGRIRTGWVRCRWSGCGGCHPDRRGGGDTGQLVVRVEAAAGD
jgi:hypothetical protein